MTTSRFAWTLSIGLAASMLAGCNPEHQLPPTQPVSGTVTLDGVALATGTIVFQSTEGLAQGIPPASGTIVDGKYEVQAPPGTHKVQINSRVETGQTDDTGLAITEEKLPAKYHSATELTADVAADGPTTKDFDLTSK